jgi:hypothetical protein
MAVSFLTHIRFEAAPAGRPLLAACERGITLQQKDQLQRLLLVPEGDRVSLLDAEMKAARQIVWRHRRQPEIDRMPDLIFGTPFGIMGGSGFFLGNDVFDTAIFTLFCLKWCLWTPRRPFRLARWRSAGISRIS